MGSAGLPEFENPLEMVLENAHYARRAGERAGGSRARRAGQPAQSATRTARISACAGTRAQMRLAGLSLFRAREKAPRCAGLGGGAWRTGHPVAGRRRIQVAGCSCAFFLP